jgi:phospholipid/cholesterol/gamma-HCH transport system substrate-binding protein
MSKGVTGTTAVSISANSIKGRMLPHDGSGTIKATAGDPSGLIPKDIRDNLTNVSNQLNNVAHDLHVLLSYHTPEQVDAANLLATQPGASTQADRPVENVATLVIRLNRTMKSLESLLTDQNLHGQVREIVKNLRDASVQLNVTLANVDATVKNADNVFSSMGTITASATKTLDSTQVQILRVSEKLVDMLGQIEKTSKQITEGNGTTGRMINDPRLYEGLVDLSKTLASTAKNLDFLLKKWKDEGVNFNLK